MRQPRIAFVALGLLAAAACNGSGSGGATAQSLGQSCVSDSDCGKVEQCKNGTCIPKVDVDAGTIGLCQDNSDCASGQICEHGACLPHQLADGGITLCHDDADCAAGDQCLGGVCLPQSIGGACDLGFLDGVGQPCASAADCSGNLSCTFGFCLPIASCQTDADCAAGKHCLDKAHVCI